MSDTFKRRGYKSVLSGSGASMKGVLIYEG